MARSSKPEGLAGQAFCTFAQCPYFRGANKETGTITCEGFTRSTGCRVFFMRDAERKRWTWYAKQYCCNDWESCPHARLMTQLFEEGVLK